MADSVAKVAAHSCRDRRRWLVRSWRKLTPLIRWPSYESDAGQGELDVLWDLEVVERQSALGAPGRVADWMMARRTSSSRSTIAGSLPLAVMSSPLEAFRNGACCVRAPSLTALAAIKPRAQSVPRAVAWAELRLYGRSSVTR
jgi:hypothetical protein